MAEKVVRRNISLYPEDWAAVERLASPAGMSISQGVRSIIREWQRLNAPERVLSIPTNPAPHTANESQQ